MRKQQTFNSTSNMCLKLKNKIQKNNCVVLLLISNNCLEEKIQKTLTKYFKTDDKLKIL